MTTPSGVDAMWENSRRWIYGATALAVLFFLLLGLLPAEGYRASVYQQISSTMMGVLVGAVVAALGASMLVILAHELFKRLGWAMKWRSDTAGRLLLAVPVVVLFGGLLWNLLTWIELLGERRWPVARAAFVQTDNLGWVLHEAARGPLPQARGVLAAMGDANKYVMTVDNVVRVGWEAGHARERVFAGPVPALTDIFPLPGMILAVSGQTLVRSTQDGRTEKVADLPGPGFRFGQGWKNQVLLFGEDGRKGMVFALNPNGSYLKIAEVDGPVTAAVGLNQETVVATGGVLILLIPGQHPQILCELPAELGSILSLTARVGPDGKNFLLFTTADMVFGLQGNVVHTLLAGVGGELRTDPKDSGWTYLMDAPRNTALRFTFAAPQKP